MNAAGSVWRFARENSQVRLLAVLLVILIAIIAFQWWASRPRSYGVPSPLTLVMRSRPSGGKFSIERGISECMKRRGIVPIWGAYDLHPTGSEVAVSFIFSDQGKTQDAVWSFNKDTHQVSFSNEAARMLSYGCR